MCIRDSGYAAFFAIGAYTTGMLSSPAHGIHINFWIVIWIAAGMAAIWGFMLGAPTLPLRCLLYTSDAADERSSVDLGGRRIITKKKTK